MGSEKRGVFIFFNEEALTSSLDRAQKKAAQLEKQMTDVGDKASPEFLKLQQQLVNSNQKITQFSDQISGKTGPTLNQMSQAVQKLRAELNNLAPGTQAFIEKAKQLQQAEKELIKVKDQVSLVSGQVKELSASSLPFFGSFAGRIGDLAGKLPSLGGAFRALWGIIIANPIIAVVAALV